MKRSRGRKTVKHNKLLKKTKKKKAKKSVYVPTYM